jgi:hypothetical protein
MTGNKIISASDNQELFSFPKCQDMKELLSVNIEG